MNSVMKILVFMMIPFFASSFVLPEESYINAVLQSTGLSEYDNTFMNNFYSSIYGREIKCVCEGCWVNNECVECLNEKTCKKLEGYYCE